jgi:hypothetical protein
MLVFLNPLPYIIQHITSVNSTKYLSLKQQIETTKYQSTLNDKYTLNDTVAVPLMGPMHQINCLKKITIPWHHVFQGHCSVFKLTKTDINSYYFQFSYVFARNCKIYRCALSNLKIIVIMLIFYPFNLANIMTPGCVINTFLSLIPSPSSFPSLFYRLMLTKLFSGCRMVQEKNQFYFFQ